MENFKVAVGSAPRDLTSIAQFRRVIYNIVYILSVLLQRIAEHVGMYVPKPQYAVDDRLLQLFGFQFLL